MKSAEPSRTSISGISAASSAAWRWTRHPVTTSRRGPVFLCSASSRIVSTLSSRAASMNAQVLTTMTSARSGSSTSSPPAAVTWPSISSVSTWFLGQPSDTTWTLRPGAPAAVGVGG